MAENSHGNRTQRDRGNRPRNSPRAKSNSRRNRLVRTRGSTAEIFRMACLASSRQHARVNDVTRLLSEMAEGDPQASDRLISVVYAELRRMAAHYMGPHANQTLQPTALVHEMWLRLGGEQMRSCQNRGHFFGTAATVMRSILVDRARRRKALRHGGGQERVPFDQIDVADATVCDDQILAVHEVLEKLAAEHPEKAELVKLRYFAGLSVKEAADVLGVSEPTVHRWWAYTRAWLGREITF